MISVLSLGEIKNVQLAMIIYLQSDISRRQKPLYCGIMHNDCVFLYYLERNANSNLLYLVLELLLSIESSLG